VKITIKNLQSKVHLNSQAIVETVRRVLLSEGSKKTGEINLLFVSDKRIIKFNRKYLDKNNPTDVIAFDLSGPLYPGKIFADIVISVDRAVDNAKIFGTSALFELCLYAAHGVLHILGYDDRTLKQRQNMQKKAEYILKKYVHT
jgi:probable rRNA maturation factor